MAKSTILDSFSSLRRSLAVLRAIESKDFEYGHNQMAVLYRLSLSNATMGELVEYALSDKASMTRTVSSLEKLGFVRRKVDQSDRRIVIIELTAKGKVHAHGAQKIRQSIGRKLEECLNVKEREQFASLVEKITNNLKSTSKE
jgi:DNA-binding MarR family transcriptional regulator